MISDKEELLDRVERMAEMLHEHDCPTCVDLAHELLAAVQVVREQPGELDPDDRAAIELFT